MNNENLIKLITESINFENKNSDYMITYSNHIKDDGTRLIIIAIPTTENENEYKNLFNRLNVYENKQLINCKFFSLDWDDFDVLCEWYEVELL